MELQSSRELRRSFRKARRKSALAGVVEYQHHIDSPACHGLESNIYVRMLHGLNPSRLRTTHCLPQKTRLFCPPKSSRQGSTLFPSPVMAAPNGAIGAMDPKNATAKTLKMENVS